MKDRKKISILLIGIIAVVALMCICVFRAVNSSNDGSISQVEWLGILEEKAGYVSEEHGSDYMNSDVCIAIACERELIDSERSASANKKATGEFVAITAMKHIGDFQAQLYLDSLDDITDKDRIHIALDVDLIDEKELKKGLSKERAEEIVTNLLDLQYTTLWKDDYSDISYADGVIELGNEETSFYDSATNNLTITDKCRELKVGDRIVFTDKVYGSLIAKEVAAINGDNVELLDVDPFEMVEKCIASSKHTVTFEDIANYYGVSESDMHVVETKSDKSDYQATFCKEKTLDLADSFTVTLKTVNGRYEVVVSNGNFEFEVPMQNAGIGTSIMMPSVELSIDSFTVATDCNYIGFIKDFDVETLINGHFAGGVRSEKSTEAKTSLGDFKVNLIKIPVVKALVVTGYVELSVNLSTEGVMYISSEYQSCLSINYSRGKGLSKNYVGDWSTPDLTLEGEIKCQVGLGGSIDFFGQDAVDLALLSGFSVDASVEHHDDPCLFCLDVNLSYPIVSLALSSGAIDEVNLTAHLVDKAENNPLINVAKSEKFHQEVLKDGNVTRGTKCTHLKEEGVRKKIVEKEEEKEEKIVQPEIDEVSGEWLSFTILSRNEDGTYEFEISPLIEFSKEEVDGKNPGDSVTSITGKEYDTFSLEQLCYDQGLNMERLKDRGGRMGIKVSGYSYALLEKNGSFFVEDPVVGDFMCDDLRKVTLCIDDDAKILEHNVPMLVVDDAPTRTGKEFSSVPIPPPDLMGYIEFTWGDGTVGHAERFWGYAIIEKGHVRIMELFATGG